MGSETEGVPGVVAVYTAGSARDGPTVELVRCGWAFTIIDGEGEVLAAAYGVTPPWITDIGGAEAWALFQSLLVTTPGQCKYWVDCLPVYGAIQKGSDVALDPRNALARVHRMLLAALQGDGAHAVGWMPLHLTKTNLLHGMANKSDGSRVAPHDVAMNEWADTLAKKGVERHRVTPSVVNIWKAKMEQVKRRAKWIGVVTHNANSSKVYPFSDSESAKWKAVANLRKKRDAKLGVDGRRWRGVKAGKKELWPEEGGHTMVRAATGHGWMCTVCKERSMARRKLAMKRCRKVKDRWMAAAGGGGADEKDDGMRRHVLRLPGTVTWCGVCGAFAETKARRLLPSCNIHIYIYICGESFTWEVKPKAFPVCGAVYTDGSARDGPTVELVRCGWAFTIIDGEGEVLAAAYGVTPPWITDIGGAEAWALFQSLLVTTPGQCKYWVDCLPVYGAIQKGSDVALDPRNALARVHRMLLAALQGDGAHAVGWMPLHLTKTNLLHGMANKSDGSRVAPHDVAMNEWADTLAKKGVERHRVTPSVVNIWKAKMEQVKRRAKWIGVVTHNANSSKVYPFSDSESAKWKAVANLRKKRDAKLGVDGRRWRGVKAGKKELWPEEGGHTMVRAATGHGWMCTVCKERSMARRKLAMKRCRKVKDRWMAAAGGGGDDEKDDGMRRHVLRMSGTVTWCGVCGAFAEARARRLLSSCNGPPLVGAGGPRAQSVYLRASIHPVTHELLPQATWCDGSAIEGTGMYHRRRGSIGGDEADGFTLCSPETFPILQPREGRSAATKRSDNLSRIRSHERQRIRRLRTCDAECEAFELYADFVGDDCKVEEAACMQCGPDDAEEMSFWNEVIPNCAPDRFEGNCKKQQGHSRS